MTQVQAQYCPNFTKEKPYMIPSFVGSFTPVESNRKVDCLQFQDQKRREFRQVYGNGTPEMNSANYDKCGVPKGAARNSVTVMTAEGAVKLPVNDQVINFIPTSQGLDFLTHTVDTRRLGEPDRYYR
jgi:hypothetical protein